MELQTERGKPGLLVWLLRFGGETGLRGGNVPCKPRLEDGVKVHNTNDNTLPEAPALGGASPQGRAPAFHDGAIRVTDACPASTIL